MFIQCASPADLVRTCSLAGVLGAIAGMLGTIQAAEVLKFITGTGELLYNQLLSFNAKSMNFRKIKFKKNPNCPICGHNPTITELVDGEQTVCDLKAIDQAKVNAPIYLRAFTTT